MKITKQNLKQIIKEELEAILNEAGRTKPWYYGPKDYSRTSGGSWEHDRTARSAGVEGGESDWVTNKKKECREKGMRYSEYKEECVDRGDMIPEGEKLEEN